MTVICCRFASFTSTDLSTLAAEDTGDIYKDDNQLYDDVSVSTMAIDACIYMQVRCGMRYACANGYKV